MVRMTPEIERRYKDKHIKRIPLDMQIAEYEAVKEHAEAAKEPVNGYIKRAIRDRMDKEDEQRV